MYVNVCRLNLLCCRKQKQKSFAIVELLPIENDNDNYHGNYHFKKKIFYKTMAFLFWLETARIYSIGAIMSFPLGAYYV